MLIRLFDRGFLKRWKLMKTNKNKKLMFTWKISATEGYESVWVSFNKGLGFLAEGRIFAQSPKLYWAEYFLEVDNLGVTRRLMINSSGKGRRRNLELRHGNNGWIVQGKNDPSLNGALDCDIAYSPLTNTMPIARYGLHHKPQSKELLMAFIEMPSLQVVRSSQKYTHLKRVQKGGLVHFSSGSFKADLLVDSRALVISYPNMADRLL
jgi:hypothetical protein